MIHMSSLRINSAAASPPSAPDSPSSYYQIETVRTKARYIIYGLSYILVLSYALWNAGKLGRPDQEVFYESAALMMVFLLGLPLLYKPFLAFVALMRQLKE